MEEVLNDIPPLESVMFDPMHRVNRQPSINLLAGVNHEKAIELFSLSLSFFFFFFFNGRYPQNDVQFHQYICGHGGSAAVGYP